MENLLKPMETYWNLVKPMENLLKPMETYGKPMET